VLPTEGRADLVLFEQRRQRFARFLKTGDQVTKTADGSYLSRQACHDVVAGAAIARSGRDSLGRVDSVGATRRGGCSNSG
jgi:hypothetical protein